MTDKIIVYSTCSDAKEAQELAVKLVEQRLAGCVNVLPAVGSFYRWKGKVEQDTEILLIIKTSRELLERVRAEWERSHSYEMPELIAVPIVDGAPNYLNWLDTELAKA